MADWIRLLFVGVLVFCVISGLALIDDEPHDTDDWRIDPDGK